MRAVIPALATGILFGAGLALSDMINPARVLAFLDLAGAWDPTLAFVLAGALIPSAIGYIIAQRMKRPIVTEVFCIPQTRTVDRRLLIGAGLFGAGWGLAGFCPGPAVAALAFGLWQPWVFVAAMLVGMILYRASTSSLITDRRARV